MFLGKCELWGIMGGVGGVGEEWEEWEEREEWEECWKVKACSFGEQALL